MQEICDYAERPPSDSSHVTNFSVRRFGFTVITSSTCNVGYLFVCLLACSSTATSVKAVLFQCCQVALYGPYISNQHSILKLTAFWDLRRCSLVQTDRSFRDAYCFWYHNGTSAHSPSLTCHLPAPTIECLHRPRYKLTCSSRNFPIRT
jgi:hypothetical protein